MHLGLGMPPRKATRGRGAKRDTVDGVRDEPEATITMDPNQPELATTKVSMHSLYPPPFVI